MTRSRRPHERQAQATLSVVVDYRQTAFGGWVAVIEPEGLPSLQVQAPDPHEALHAALEALQGIADETDAALATVHQLQGDPEAWAELAIANDFQHCVVHGGHDGFFVG